MPLADTLYTGSRESGALLKYTVGQNTTSLLKFQLRINQSVTKNISKCFLITGLFVCASHFIAVILQEPRRDHLTWPGHIKIIKLHKIPFPKQQFCRWINTSVSKDNNQAVRCSQVKKSSVCALILVYMLPRQALPHRGHSHMYRGIFRNLDFSMPGDLESTHSLFSLIKSHKSHKESLKESHKERLVKNPPKVG